MFQWQSKACGLLYYTCQSCMPKSHPNFMNMNLQMRLCLTSHCSQRPRVNTMNVGICYQDFFEAWSQIYSFQNRFAWVSESCMQHYILHMKHRNQIFWVFTKKYTQIQLINSIGKHCKLQLHFAVRHQDTKAITVSLPNIATWEAQDVDCGMAWWHAN